jgi:sigma-B regulation protein RsbU (phosphoserine phosphatase)
MKELHRNFMTLNLDYDKYFSLFFCMYNKSTKELQYVNAGHNSLPVLLRDGEATKLEAKGYPICNIFDFVEYDVNKIRLQEKDRLFFYTDGITEAQNELGQEFGEERLINLIEKDDNILEKLSTVLKNYSKVQKDDYAILIAEII